MIVGIVLVTMLAVPSIALADEALGDVDRPSGSTAAEEGSQSDTASPDAVSSSDADEEVLVSSEGDAARIPGYAYGIEDFVRAQVGSNRPFDGVYRGYCYYVGDRTDNLSVISTGEYAVVHVPPAAVASFSLDLDDTSTQDILKRYLIALDEGKAMGSARLSAVATWYFTSDSSFEVEGVRFSFDQELEPGSYYACVIGSDGSDVTDRENPAFVNLAHADFGRLVPADEVDIVVAATGLAALAEFLRGIDYSPLWVTLKTTGAAIAFIFVLGLAAAYFSLRIPARAQDVFDSIFTIPMVLPPTVCGFLLLLALGRNTALGQWFIDIGFPLIFSWPATVIAAVVVAFPLMYRSARGAFENLDPTMLDAARTLGWSNPKIFFRLMLPLSWSSIAAGTVLAFARALGEFGATLFLAGNYLGITRTIPIAIYFEWMNGNTDVAIFWTIIIIIFSFMVILFINLWSRRTTKYRRGAET